MWSKIKNLLNRKKELSPAEMIDSAIQQLQTAVDSQKRALKEAAKHEEEVQADLARITREADQLYQQARKYALTGDDANAQRMLTQEQFKREQQLQYDRMMQQTSQTVLRLQQHIHTLELKLQDMRSKRILLITQLESAKTQQDINAYLGEMGDGVFSGLEDALAQSEIALAISKGADIEDLEIDKALNAPQKNASVEELRRQSEEQERKRRAAEEAKRMQHIERMFEATKNLNPKKQEDPKKQLLDQLMADKREVDPKKQLLDQFMAKEEAPKKPLPEQSAPKEEPKKPNTNDFSAPSKTENLLDSFFKADPPKKTDDGKQQLLDDFFKD